MSRTATVERATKESEVFVALDVDGTGEVEVTTGVPFFDHMMSQLGKHGGFDLKVRTVGDLEVDAHHTVEDTSLAFGQALREALGARRDCAATATPWSHWTRRWYPARSTSPAPLPGARGTGDRRTDRLLRHHP